MTAQRIKVRPLTAFICSIFIVCAGLVLLYVKGDKYPPQIRIESSNFLGKESVFTVHISSNGAIDGSTLHIGAIQKNKREKLSILEEQSEKPSELVVSVALTDTTTLSDGDIEIEVSARSLHARSGLGGLFASTPTVKTFPLKVDFTPPAASYKLHSPVLTRGGAVLLSIETGECLSGIELMYGGAKYDAYQIRPGIYAALVAFPQDAPYDGYHLGLRMSDEVGNINNIDISVPGENFQFRQDPIWLGDKFLQAKQKEFSEYLGKNDASPVELFLIMNSQSREDSYRRLAALCKYSSPEKLWQGEFMEMPGAARRSEFADRRNYVYKNEVIDKQVHLGLDYASIAKDKIPAANSGMVAFTGYLGIHGNAVLIDHGLGLFSLYSHLSSTEVDQGQKVEKGQIIGRTGTTGMAGGDHLHFEIMVGGVSINPDFFYNGTWLGENIDAPLARLMEVKK